MTIKRLLPYTFKDDIGYFSTVGYGAYVEGKGFVSFDGKKPYSPAGGKKALEEIEQQGGFINHAVFVSPVPEH